MTDALIKLFYLLAAVMFILGLKRLSSPATARSGNWLASLGMLIAIVVTLVFQEILGWREIIIGMIVGSLVGGIFARTVKMTGMPQMVALLNGFGGGASALVASAEYFRYLEAGQGIPINFGVAIQLSVLIGLMIEPNNPLAFYGVLIGAALLGVTSVIPIGGADMPVVISLLNSYSGIAAAMTGFVINNEGLIISGALVGASGLILTNIMCRAMNRSLANVLFGAFGATVAEIGGPDGAPGDLTVRSLTHEDAATMLAYARQVVFTPGYGLAVAQAQHEVRELADMLQDRGVQVKYAIHPVAGRMPGHMNVLLAEADVPYDQLYDMDQINPEFPQTDVSVVIGANDVVNPVARHDKSSPLYGMPILDVDKATHCIVMKRSMRPGFAGVDNELFYQEKTSMLFGDAKDSFKKLIQEVQQL
jgi:NAD(P) transhydrogenase subunit beta